MSISKMKKLVVIAPTENVDTVISKLMSLRCVDIRNFSCGESDDLLKKANYDEQIAQCEENIQKIDSVMPYIYKYSKKRARIGRKRASVDRADFVECGNYDVAIDLVWKAYDLIAQIEKAEDKEVSNGLIDELKQISLEKSKIEALFDVENTNLLVLQTKKKASVSESCTFILGWMPKKAVKKVETTLADLECAYEIEEPTDDEEPPVSLSNNPITRSFEWLVSGIVCPKYRTFDPTFITSIFYFLAFGLMLPDIGYGAILVLLGLIGSLIIGVRGKTKTMFKMLGWCGFSSVIFGALFGSWFGDMPYAVMQGLLGIEKPIEIFPLFNGVWFNYAQKPIYYLAICLAFGLVQIVVGMIIKFVLLCKDGKAVDAAFGILPWWGVLVGVAVALKVNMTAGVAIVGACLLVVLFFSNRTEKNVSARLRAGLRGLCKLGIYVIDLLGFLKIFVLGVTLSIVTHWINVFGTMMGASTLGYAIFVFACVVCHGICFCAASFVAFLIANTLQRNEFFKQFLTDGGERFSPIVPMEKYTVDSCKK